MSATDGAESLGCAVHEIGAGAAVDVQIDKARREIATMKIDYICIRWSRRSRMMYGGDPRTIYRRRTAFKQTVSENDGPAGIVMNGHGGRVAV